MDANDDAIAAAERLRFSGQHDWRDVHVGASPRRPAAAPLPQRPRLVRSAVIAVALACSASAVVALLDWRGLIDLGLFHRDLAPVAVRPPARRPALLVKAPQPQPPSEPIWPAAVPLEKPAAPPAAPAKAIDPAQVRLLTSKLAAAERGIAVISKELKERQAEIAAAELALARFPGLVSQIQGEIEQIERGLWRPPPRDNGEKLRMLDARRVQLRNLAGQAENARQELARDQGVERSLRERLTKAEGEASSAKAALNALSPATN